MKTIVILTCLIAFFGFRQKTTAQTLNWKTSGKAKHVLSAGIGWDYSASYSLGYAYQLEAPVPVVLNTRFSIPSGERLLDDFKTSIGAQVLLFNGTDLKGSISLNGLYRRYENPLVILQNIGSELKGTFGYYRPNWFLAAEAGLDKAIVTRFKHSESFKETIFQDVTDGWYQPATGGHVFYGLQTGYSFTNSDINLRIGMVTTQDFTTTPLIPYYVMIGYNQRIE